MSWDPYYRGKRNIIYISPLVAVLCAVALSGVVALSLVSHPLSNMLSLHAHDVSSSIRGEWVGTLQVDEIRDSTTYVPTLVNKRAAILLNLGATNSALREFGGKGKMKIEGEARERSIRISRLQPKADSTGTSYRAEIISGENTSSNLIESDGISGNVEGSISDGVLQLRRRDTSGYLLHGTLHRGTLDQYKVLVARLF